jgi:hypothetical protein
MEAYRVVRRRGCYIFYRVGSLRPVKLQTLRAGRALLQRHFLVHIPVRGWIKPRVVVRLEGLGKLKNYSSSSGFEPATIRFVA